MEKPLTLPRIARLAASNEKSGNRLHCGEPESRESRALSIQIENVDAGWQGRPVRAGKPFITILPPGKYRFVVSASNGDNLWNEAGAAMNMEVSPAFNQTTWFRSLCVMAAMLGLWGILRFRVRQSVVKVQAQFRERMRERERIAADLHDTLLQGYLSASLHVHAAFGRLAEDSPAKQPLRRALELIGKASEESRIALQGIRSSQLGDLELGAGFVSGSSGTCRFRGCGIPGAGGRTPTIFASGSPG